MEYPTGIGTSDATSIHLLGHDLAGEVIGRTLPLNGAGVAGAALADIGLPPELLRGVALLARAAGLLGHIAEELRHPIAPDIYSLIDRNAVYRPTASNNITEQR